MKGSYKTYLYWGVIVGLFGLMLASQISKTMMLFSGTGPGLGPEYMNQPWREDANADITKTLAGAKASGCEQFRYREHPTANGEFLVHCTTDGTNWQAYLVWPQTGKVLGPLQPDVSTEPR